MKDKIFKPTVKAVGFTLKWFVAGLMFFAASEVVRGIMNAQPKIKKMANWPPTGV